MKLNRNLSLAIIASMSLLLPLSAIADDQKQDEKKQQDKKAGRQQHGREVAPPKGNNVAAPSAKKPLGGDIHSRGTERSARLPDVAPRPSQSTQTGKRSEPSQPNRSVQPDSAREVSQIPQFSGRDKRGQRNRSIQSNVAPATSLNSEPGSRVQRNQRNRTHEAHDQRTYNKANNYGGLWFAENSHTDWRRDQNYYWNHHNYRWYEGGWLIIDGGFSPDGFNTGSTASNVQMRLANQGYYHGPIDGDIGPDTRNAIADYQNDHDMRITGRISYSLLQSLRVQ